VLGVSPALSTIVPASCPPIITTSFSPYEQQLIGGVVVVYDVAAGWIAFTIVVVIKRQ